MGQTRRRERSFQDVLGAAERFLHALAIRAGGADEFELGELVGLRDQLEDAIVMTIAMQLEQGKSWTSIGDALGMTKQAAHKRYAPLVEARQSAPVQHVPGRSQDGVGAEPVVLV